MANAPGYDPTQAICILLALCRSQQCFAPTPAHMWSIVVSCGAMCHVTAASRLQPQPVTESELEAWYMDDSTADQRQEHRCAVACAPARPTSVHCSGAATGHLRLLIHSLHVHRQEPNAPVHADELRKLGVLSWKLNQNAFENDPKLEAIRSVRGYSYQVTARNLGMSGIGFPQRQRLASASWTYSVLARL